METVIENFSNYIINDSLKEKQTVLNIRRKKYVEGGKFLNYWRYCLHDDKGKQHVICLHKLLAMAFIPNPNNLSDVHHIIPLSEGGTNAIDNLVWLSHEDHMSIHAKERNGDKNDYFGKTIRPKLVGKYDKYNNLLEIYKSTMDAERQTLCHHSHVSNCCKGKRKTCGGYIWKYITKEQYDEYMKMLEKESS